MSCQSRRHGDRAGRKEWSTQRKWLERRSTRSASCGDQKPRQLMQRWVASSNAESKRVTSSAANSRRPAPVRREVLARPLPAGVSRRNHLRPQRARRFPERQHAVRQGPDELAAVSPPSACGRSPSRWARRAGFPWRNPGPRCELGSAARRFPDAGSREPPPHRQPGNPHGPAQRRANPSSASLRTTSSPCVDVFTSLSM